MSSDRAIVLTHYMLPERRLHEHFVWNRDVYRREGVRVLVVSDRDHELPGYAQVLVIGPLFNSENHFSLAWCSNMAIRAAIELGATTVCKTDPDILFPSRTLATMLEGTRPGVGYSPLYMMAESEDQAILAPESCRPWNNSRGTVCLAASDWDALAGYDERMRGYGSEDGDLTTRAAQRSITIARGTLPVYHIDHDGTQGRVSPRARANNWNSKTLNPRSHTRNAPLRNRPWRGPKWGSRDGPCTP